MVNRAAEAGEVSEGVNNMEGVNRAMVSKEEDTVGNKEEEEGDNKALAGVASVEVQLALQHQLNLSAADFLAEMEVVIRVGEGKAVEGKVVTVNEQIHIMKNLNF